MGNMNTEILHIVSICMSGEILLEDQKIGLYRPDKNQGHLFCLVARIQSRQ